MGALLGHGAGIQHDDAVGVPDGGEPVGDDQGGAAPHQPGQRLVDQFLVDGVQVRGGLVEHQHGRVLEQRPGDGQALPLAAGKLHPALARHRVVARGEPGDEAVDVGQPRGFFHRVRGRVGPAQADVVAQRGVEQVGVLGHQRDLRPQAVQCEVPEVPARQRHRAGRGVPEAQQEMGAGGLAGARGTHQGHGLPRLHVQAHVPQRQAAARAVAEAHAVEADGRRTAAVGRQGRRAGPVPHRHGLVLDLEHAPARLQRLHQFLDRAGHVGHRPEGQQGEHGGQRQQRPVHLELAHQPYPGGEHRQGADAGHRLVEAGLERLVFVEGELGLGEPQAPGQHGRGPLLLVAEGEHLAHPLDAVHQVGVELPQLPAHRAPQPVRTLLGEERRQGQHREERGQGQHQRPAHEPQHGEDARGYHHRDERRGDGVGEEELHGLHVGAGDAHQVAGAAPGQVGRRQRVQGVVEVDAHLGQELVGEVVGQPAVRPGEHGRDPHHGRQQRQVEGQVLAPDELAHQQRAGRARAHHRCLEQHARGERHRELAPERPHQRRQPPQHGEGRERLRRGVRGPRRRRFRGFGELGPGLRNRSLALGQGLRAALPGLGGHEPRVSPAALDQRSVAAGLHHPAPLQHQDAVRVDDAGQAVRDDERGAPLHELPQGLVDHRLALGVHARQGFVEDQDGGVLEDGPGDGDALALAAGEPGAALAHHGLVPLREPGDEVMDVGRPGGPLQLLLGGFGLGHAQVVRDGAVEQVGVLGHHRDVPAQDPEGDGADVPAAQQHAPLPGVGEAQHERHQGRFARSAGTHDPELLARAQLQRHVPERGPAALGVGEVHPLEADLGLEGGLRRGFGRRGLAHRGRGLQQGEDALGRGHGVDALVVEDHQLPHGAEDLRAHDQDHDQRAHLQLAGGHLEDAPAHGAGRAPQDAEGGDAHGDHVHRQHAHGGAVEVPRPGRQGLPLAAAPAEDLEGGDALDAVQEVGAEGPVGKAPALAALLGEQQEQRRGHERDQGEGHEDQPDDHVEGSHEEEDQHRRDPGHRHLRQELAVEDLEPLHPLAQGHQHVAGALPVEVSGPQVQGMPVQLVVQPGLHPGRGLLSHHVPQVLEQRPQGDEPGHRGQVGKQRREGGAGEDAGDDQPGEGQTRDAGGHGAEAE